MTRPNGHGENLNAGLRQQPEEGRIVNSVPISPQPPEPLVEVATRAKQRARQPGKPNRFVIVVVGAIVTALLIFAAVSSQHRGRTQKTKNRGAMIEEESTVRTSGDSDDKSLFPITDSGRPPSTETHQGFVDERDLQRTVVRSGAIAAQSTSPNAGGSLGSIPPFGDKSQPAAYEPGPTGDASEVNKAEREALEKSSLVYVGKLSNSPTGLQTINDATPALGLGLGAGTRLRARLESAASTAVRTPVLAVIEYNYAQSGELIVPAGAKAVGHIRQANRSGYVELEFDSLLMPDGSSVPIEAAAAGLDLRPLKGKVEGRNTGKNVLVRLLSGIGQAGSLFLGQGTLNQPVSESDLMRERLASNIGETGDEEVSRLAVNQQIVVTVPAGIPIYLVLQQTAKSHQAPLASGSRGVPAASGANVDQLRQLLELQQELNQSNSK